MTTIPSVIKRFANFAFALALTTSSLSSAHTAPVRSVSTDELSREVSNFLGRELAAHVSDIQSLNPPQQRVVGALTVGEFSWGAFGRSLASYSALSGEETIAGKDIPKLIGQIGLIESRQGGKTFAQLYATIALRHFGTNLATNPVWQSLTPAEQDEWRSLLDPSRFYDRKIRRVINLPENYFGVAARVVAVDYELGIIKDRAFVDDVLDRAAEQFVSGNLYSDDGLPTGRYDRYSNEYARYVYYAAETVGRQDIMKALEPTLKTQMRTWWDLMSPDGYGYSWGRSLGAISYIDTLEIVGFLAAHPQFRPAPLPDLVSAYFKAWKWLRHDYQDDRHLLNVLGFGRGNYPYINKQREWQQTGAFFGKVAGAHAQLVEALKRESIATVPADIPLANVARFEYFRRTDRPCGVWIVRRGDIHFALPIVAGTKPGSSDYLPAPYGLTGFAPPVEQSFPTVTPFLELADGSVISASGCADEIISSQDGTSLRAIWKNWEKQGTKAGQAITPGIIADVTWLLENGTLRRVEKLTATSATEIRRFWVAVPTTGSTVVTSMNNGARGDIFSGHEGKLKVEIQDSAWPLASSVIANGDGALGKGSRGPVPLYLSLETKDQKLSPGTPFHWTLILTPKPSSN